MKRISKPIRGLLSAVVGGGLVMAVLQLASLGQQGQPPAPRFNIQQTPINRDIHGVTSYAPIIRKAAPSVVNIYSTRTVSVRRYWNPFSDNPFFRPFSGDESNPQAQRPRTRREQDLGSGVVVSSDGYILTANHVVDGADLNGVKVVLATGGKEFTAKVVGTDPPTDVAVLKVDAKDLPAITIADSDKLEVGDVVLAIGNPFQIGQTVTMGIVSAVGRGNFPFGQINQYEDFIQTDAAINPGNSGGALVDAEGRLVGINTAIISESGGYQGVGFAVPINLARNVMDSLIKNGKVTRGYLGLLPQNVTPDLAKAFNLPDENGVLIGDVTTNSPAARAGLKEGDVIREIDGKKVTGDRQFRLTIADIQPDTKVTLKILRNGKEQTLTATVGKLDELRQTRGARRSRANPQNNPPADQAALDGVEVADLSANLRRQLNLPNSVQGALVTNVEEGSNAAEAGLRPGDIIQEINRQPVRNADETVNLSDKAKGDQILLRVWTQGVGRYVAVNNSKHK
jgi:serine protease Do